MMNKIYCRNCRHYWENEFGNACEAVTTATDDWYTPGHIHATPSKQNKNNDCKHWQHKRTLKQWLIEWLNNVFL